MSYRAAVLGCGRIGSGLPGFPASLGIYAHAPAYLACAKTELVALADPEPACLAACANLTGQAACFSSFETLLAEAKPELVSICTPDATHFTVAQAVLAAPYTRGILLEKPLALEIEEAEELLRAARKREIVLAVNYSRRYAPAIQELRQALASDALGPVRSVTGYYSKGTLHNATHWFDLLRLLAGEVSSIEAFDRLKETGADPSLDCHLQMASGANAHLIACDASAYTLFEMDVIAQEGRIRILNLGQTIKRYQAAAAAELPGYRLLRRDGIATEVMRDVTLHAVEDLVLNVTSGGIPRCSGEDATAALRIALGAQRSAKEGRLVTFA